MMLMSIASSIWLTLKLRPNVVFMYMEMSSIGRFPALFPMPYREASTKTVRSAGSRKTSMLLEYASWKLLWE